MFFLSLALHESTLDYQESAEAVPLYQQKWDNFTKLTLIADSGWSFTCD